MSDFDLSSVGSSMSDFTTDFDTDNMLETAAGVAIASVGLGLLSWGITKVASWVSTPSNK